MNIETRLYDAIRYIGVLAPVPTAYVIAVSLQKHLSWHILIAIIAAVIVEVVGFGVVYMYAIFREYNQSKRKTDPLAPLNIVSWMVVLYVAAVLLLTVVLDIFPRLSLYAPGLFPFLSVIGMALTALRYDHEKRLQLIEGEKQERKQARNQEQPKATAPVDDGLHGNKKAIRELLSGNPNLSQAKIAETIGISRQAVGKHIAQLHNAGLLNNPAAHGAAANGQIGRGEE